MSLFKGLKKFAFALIVPVIISSPLQASAASTPINTGAKVSFTFDDGLSSAYSQAAPTLAKYGFSGTDYVISGCVGMTTAPNTCHANTDTTYMTWAQVQALQNTYGWEIGSHTVDHSCLASSSKQDPGDCPAKALTTAQVDKELSDSKTALTANGLNVTDFASPYGDYNPTVLAEIAKYYASHRGFADTGYNGAPYNNYILRDQQVQGNVSVATVESYVDQAIANHQWLILTFHDILTNASTNPDDYQYSTANLDAIAAYIKSKSVPVVNINNGLINGTNLLTDSTFDNGLANGWTTDAAAQVKKDAANHGSNPSPTNSVLMTASTKDVHLFSPKVNVDSNSTYILQSFLNLTKINAGYSVGYYIDEYDINGNWISGQYKQSINFPWAQTTGFEYKPSSANVKSASLQVIMPGNSTGTAYVDNFQWILENTVTPPVQTQTNLVPNGTFDSGISGGWTTDGPSNIVADSANNGSPANPVNSVKMTATTTNKHLFSPKVVLVAGKTYTISTYVNIKQITSGEVGFYVDEYDASGNWVSGKYITGVRAAGATTVSFNYIPSSTNVKSASLQIILVGNSGIVAYVDNVVWLQN